MEEGTNVKNGLGTPPPGRGGPQPPQGGQYGRPGYDVHYHYYYEPPKVKRGKSSKPTIAGALLIIHGIVAILLAAMLVMLLGTVAEGGEFFGMSDTAEITGTVIYENGTPAEGVTISIIGEDISTQTGSNGGYYIYDAPVGNQRIMVEKEGYKTIIHKTFISPSDPNNPDSQGNDHEFTLRPGTETIEQGAYLPWAFLEALGYVCASIMVITSVIAIIGGIYAIKREHYGFTLAASVAGIISLGVLAAIALFILIISKDEFEKQDQTPPPNTPGGGPEDQEGPP